MVSQEEKAKMRYEVTQKIIQTNKEISDTMIFALMLSNYGIRDRTVALYLKSLEALGKITIKGHIVSWVEVKTK